MRELLLIGIGTGNPDHVTVQAVAALNRARVFFVVDKGAEKTSLLALRTQILRRHVRDQDGYRVVEIPDPPRDRTAAAYAGAVDDWHERRAELFAAAIRDELGPDEVGAFLVWGDPALYDSTLRVLDKIRDVEFEYSVIAGITSVQALTAAHRLPLNRIGEPIVITPARRLAADATNAVVLLDGGFAAAEFADTGFADADVYWGAYLGSPDEVLIAGRLSEVAAEIVATKARLREQHGWIMDSYLVRRSRPDE